MNPIDIEPEIRALELMLYGGSPVRPAADFGRQEMGHFDPARVRAPEVYPVVTGGATPASQKIVESYILSEDGSMRVRTGSEGE
jgi:hypothetical protein